MEAPVCECGCKMFTHEMRQVPIDKQFVDAKTYWYKHVWENYLDVYHSRGYAVCDLCKAAYEI